MKLGFVVSAIALVALTTVSHAKRNHAADAEDTPDPGKVLQAVDTLNSTITITEDGEQKLYHMDPFATITLNGAQSTLKKLIAGEKVDSLSLTDPTTISDIKLSDAPADASDAPSAPETTGAATPAVSPGPGAADVAQSTPADMPTPVPQEGSTYFGTSGSTLSPQELAQLSAKLVGTYWIKGEWATGNAWLYLDADGTLVDNRHRGVMGSWTLIDSQTLGIRDGGGGPMQQYPLNADYSTAGAWTRLAEPKPEMAAKVQAVLPAAAQSSPP
jgi:hypothetical protein